MRTTLLAITSITLCACSDPSTPPTAQRSLASTGACGIQIGRINYAQRGDDDGSLELVELWAPDAPPGATFGDCGVTALAAFEGSGEGPCAIEAASRRVELRDVVIDASRRLVITAKKASALSPTQPAITPQIEGAFLENGPDLIALMREDTPLFALAIATKSGPPRCSMPEGPPVVTLPVDDDPDDLEHLVALCDGVYQLQPMPEAMPLPAPSCAQSAPGAAGAAGAPPSAPPRCSVRVSKLDARQPPSAGRPTDEAEALELEVTGDVAEARTLSDCGASALSLFNANSSGGGCGPRAGAYLELALGPLPIPTSRRVVVGNVRGAALSLETASGQRHGVVQDGPDEVVLFDAQRRVTHALSYASASGAAPTCHADAPARSVAPAEEPASSPLNHVLVRCDDGGYRPVVAAAIAWGEPTSCDATATEAPREDEPVSRQGLSEDNDARPVKTEGAAAPPRCSAGGASPALPWLVALLVALLRRATLARCAAHRS